MLSSIAEMEVNWNWKKDIGQIGSYFSVSKLMSMLIWWASLSKTLALDLNLINCHFYKLIDVVMKFGLLLGYTIDTRGVVVTQFCWPMLG